MLVCRCVGVGCVGVWGCGYVGGWSKGLMITFSNQTISGQSLVQP